MQAEVKANDAQVLKTNVRIGSYNGWKPRDPKTASKKALPPKSSYTSKLSTSDIMTPSTQISHTLPKEIPNLIWSESDMFVTSKQQFYDEPLSKINYSEHIPKIEEKTNKKNESCLNFAHRIDLKILNTMNGTPDHSKDLLQRKRGGSTAINQDIPRDQVFTLGQLQDDIRGSH